MQNAHEFPEVYKDLGVDLRDLGCLMLDTESPWEAGIPTRYEQWAYVSPDPKKFWVKGFLKDWHCTLRYGFMPNVRSRHVDRVLEGWQFPEWVSTGNVEIFPSPYPDEQYDCYVLRIEDEVLEEMNAQLSVLPNISTFVEYKPHVTLGYFQAGLGDLLVREIRENTRMYLPTIGYNYGHILSKED